MVGIGVRRFGSGEANLMPHSTDKTSGSRESFGVVQQLDLRPIFFKNRSLATAHSHPTLAQLVDHQFCVESGSQAGESYYVWSRLDLRKPLLTPTPK